jgi:hypothetical protein
MNLHNFTLTDPKLDIYTKINVDERFYAYRNVNKYANYSYT